MVDIGPYIRWREAVGKYWPHDGDARVEGTVDDANHRRRRAFQRVERGAEGASESGSPIVFVPSIAVRYKFVSSIATPFYT